jgi:protein-S-isoprenylcysteine O-methyltransferase Ste14
LSVKRILLMKIFPKPYADLVARLRVPMGFVLAVAFVWLSQPTTQSIGIGALCALPGLLLRGWAAGHLRKNAKLTCSGPYRFIRNPLYVGTLIVAAGLVVAAQQLLLGALFAAVFVLVYLPAIGLEEQHLRNLFPDYDAYARRVPLLFPRRKPYEATERFSFTQYLYNREYEALLGFLVGLGFLFAKANLQW